MHPDVVFVSQAFVDLQEARHAADYDLSVSFLRQDVLALLKQVERALQAWKRVKNDPSARMYSICLLMAKRLSR